MDAGTLAERQLRLQCASLQFLLRPRMATETEAPQRAAKTTTSGPKSSQKKKPSGHLRCYGNVLLSSTIGYAQRRGPEATKAPRKA